MSYLYMNKSINHFGVFGRTLLLLLLLCCCTVPTSYAKEEGTVHILWKKGNQFFVRSSNALWEIASDKVYPQTMSFRLGTDKIHSLEDLAQSESDHIEELKEQSAILQYASKMKVILSNKSMLTVHSENDELSFTAVGTQHLLIPPSQNRNRFRLNKHLFQSQGAHLFFQGNETKMLLFVIQGTVSLIASEGSKNYYLQKGDILSLKSGLILVQHNAKIDSKIYQATYIPGFEKVDDFRPIGIIRQQGRGFQLVRLGTTYQIKRPTYPLVVKDLIKNLSQQTLQITFHTEEEIRLYPGAEFKISAFEQPSENGIKKNVFEFLGKIRSKIKKSVHPIQRLFQTKTGIIAVKGTEFETTGSAKALDILSVEGTVGIRDADGKGEVVVNEGMMSQVIEGEKPSPPQKIPEALYKTLLANSIKEATPPKLLPESIYELDKMSLRDRFEVILKWNEPLQQAQLLIGTRNYDLRLVENNQNSVIGRSLLRQVPPGSYPVAILAKDKAGNSTKITAVLELGTLPELCQDADFSKKTPEEIKEFQTRYGLSVDGILGEKTQGKLNELCGF